MDNLPLIKWHVQELCKLFEQHPNDYLMAELNARLEGMLNSPRFKKIKAAAPGGLDKNTIQDDDT